MLPSIEPTLKSIAEYLQLEKHHKFVVPEYQRQYSWTITQCDKLFQDIELIQERQDLKYFFGTIIVNISCKEFILIDGQQRTTTFLLLLKALLIRLCEAIPNVSDSDKASQSLKRSLESYITKILEILYQAEPTDLAAIEDKMFKDKDMSNLFLMFENKSINELYRFETKTIIESVDFRTAENSVTKIPRLRGDNKYTDHFRNFKFFYTKLGDQPSKLNTFAKTFLGKCQVIEIKSWQIDQAITMFNSLNSTGTPLSDANIISAKFYSNIDEQRKLEFINLWKNINELAHDLETRKIVNIDSILQQLMYIDRAEQNDKDVSTPGLRRYYTEIRNNQNNKFVFENPFDVCYKLLKIAQIWREIKYYPIIKLVLRCNENIKLFLSSYLYRYELNDIKKEIILDVCECLLKLFIILELSDTSYSSSKFKTFLFDVNTKLVDKNISIEAIKKEFNDHINKHWQSDDIENMIIENEKSLLVFINEYLFSKNNNIDFDFDESVNIEHIMPSSGRNITTIQTDANITDEDEFKHVVNKLGNKILLEADINKSIGNEWFRTKKQNTIKDKLGYQNSKFGIAVSLIQFPKDMWTKEDIDKATIAAAKRITRFIFDI